MALVIGDRVYSEAVDDEAPEGEDYEIGMELYGTYGDGGSSCSTPAVLGAPRDLTGVTGVVAYVNDVGSRTPILGRATLVASGNVNTPARVTLSIGRDEIALALAQPTTARELSWTIFSFDSGLKLDAQVSGRLVIQASGYIS